MLPEPTTTTAPGGWFAFLAGRLGRRTDPAPRRSHDHDADRVDLFTPAPPSTGSRFDDTTAWPIDTPRRLDATVRTVSRRLAALPPPQDLPRRSLQYRLHLQRILRETKHALARLDEGTYGTCVECAAPISLTALVETPWASVCAWCAADISPGPGGRR